MDQDDVQDQQQFTGDDLAELHDVASQLQMAGDPRAARVANFIAAQSGGGGDGSDGPGFAIQEAEPVPSWQEDLESDLWGDQSAETGAEGESEAESGGTENGTSNATQFIGAGEDAATDGEGSTSQEVAEPKLPQIGPGPAQSDPLAWNAFMQGLDSHKVGDYTVGGLANVLTNESRDLGVGPGSSVLDKDLEDAKYVQAHAIINNAMLEDPHDMAGPTVTNAAATSAGHPRDIAIMRQAYFDRMTKGADPAEGRTYFGNSAATLRWRRIGRSRQSPFKRFGPFALGSQPRKYIYIFNDPEEK